MHPGYFFALNLLQCLGAIAELSKATQMYGEVNENLKMMGSVSINQASFNCLLALENLNKQIARVFVAKAC